MSDKLKPAPKTPEEARPTAVIVGDNKSNSRMSLAALSRLSRGTVVSVLAIVVLLIGLGLYGLSRYESNSAKTGNTTPNTSPYSPSITPDQLAQQYAGQGKYAAAQQVYVQELQNTTDKPTQATIYARQAALALQFQRYADAKAYAAKILVAQPNNIGMYYQSLAYIAEAQGDKKSAAADWQRVINSLDKKSPSYPMTLRQAQANLQRDSP